MSTSPRAPSHLPRARGRWRLGTSFSPCASWRANGFLPPPASSGVFGLYGSPFFLFRRIGRERRELIADARHVPLLLNVRLDLELHHGCRPSGYVRARRINLLFATRADERDAAGARGEDSGDGFLSRLAGTCDDDARGARCGTVAGDNTFEACRRVAKWKATAATARLTLLLPPPRRAAEKHFVFAVKTHGIVVRE